MAPTYYRNTTELQGILPGSLWQLQHNQLVLVDDDQFVAVGLDKLHQFQAANQTNRGFKK